MSPCRNRRLADLLYAFELGLLDESDSHDVETHLYECEECFHRARRFDGATRLLLNDPDVHADLKAEAAEDAAAGGEGEKSVAPESPTRKSSLLARYLLAAALLLAVGVPLYHYSTEQVVQRINLTPMRGGEGQMLSLDQGGIAEIHISLEMIKAGGRFDLVLHAVDGDTVLDTHAFTGFDSTGMAVIEVPVRTLGPGYQMLSITDPTGAYLESSVHFLFQVQ